MNILILENDRDLWNKCIPGKYKIENCILKSKELELIKDLQNLKDYIGK